MKVVGATGELDLGLSTSFIPNQSRYLGAGLMIKIKNSVNDLQLYDTNSKAASSYHISILNRRLAFDYFPVTEGNGDNWEFLACQEEGTECYFITASRT